MTDTTGMPNEDDVKKKMDNLFRSSKENRKNISGSQETGDAQKKEDETSQKNNAETESQSKNQEAGDAQVGNEETSELSDLEKTMRGFDRKISQKDVEVKKRETFVKKAVERDPDYLIEIHNEDAALADKISQDIWGKSYDELLEEAKRSSLAENDREKYDIKREILKEIEPDLRELRQIRAERGGRLIAEMKEKYPVFAQNEQKTYEYLNKYHKNPQGGYNITLEQAIKLAHWDELQKMVGNEAIIEHSSKDSATLSGNYSRRMPSKPTHELSSLEEYAMKKMGVSREKWLANKPK